MVCTQHSLVYCNRQNTGGHRVPYLEIRLTWFITLCFHSINSHMCGSSFFPCFFCFKQSVTHLPRSCCLLTWHVFQAGRPDTLPGPPQVGIRPLHTAYNRSSKESHWWCRNRASCSSHTVVHLERYSKTMLTKVIKQGHVNIWLDKGIFLLLLFVVFVNNQNKSMYWFSALTAISKRSWVTSLAIVFFYLGAVESMPRVQTGRQEQQENHPWNSGAHTVQLEFLPAS